MKTEISVGMHIIIGYEKSENTLRSQIHRDRICTVAIEVVNLFWTRRGYFWNNPSTFLDHASNLGKQDTVHVQ